jgi:hypothetical protein
MEGYPQELQDCAEAIAHGRPPKSSARLGRDVLEVIYAAYVSVEEGRRIGRVEIHGVGGARFASRQFRGGRPLRGAGAAALARVPWQSPRGSSLPRRALPQRRQPARSGLRRRFVLCLHGWRCRSRRRGGGGLASRLRPRLTPRPGNSASFFASGLASTMRAGSTRAPRADDMAGRRRSAGAEISTTSRAATNTRPTGRRSRT